MIFSQTLKYIALCAIFVFITYSGAQAQSGDRLPPPDAATISINTEFSPTEETHPPLRLTPNKSRILMLDEKVARVVISNETHINVIMDTEKRLVVIPRVPGSTHFTLLGENGKIIMQRHVIVASPQEKYVRIRRSCKGAEGCLPVRMFYCPGICHEMAITTRAEVKEEVTAKAASEAAKQGK